MPLVSVVMPSLNQARFIDAAIDSVLGQGSADVELIVADGGSTDGTVEMLKARQAADERLRWDSGKDAGPAAAINAALPRVRGTVVGWLNSDDLYAPGAISRAVAALEQNPHWLMVYGHGQHVDAAGSPLGDYPTLPPSTPIEKFNEGCFICQPTVFFRRSMFVLLGKFDVKLKTAFDFDYWLRVFSAFPDRVGFVDAVQAYSRLHADCITVRSRRAVALEGMALLTRYLGHAPKEWLLTYLEEMLSAEGDDLNSVNLRSQAYATLDEAAGFMTPGDVEIVRRRIDIEPRFGDIGGTTRVIGS